MQINHATINTNFLLKKLQSSTGTEFELYAQRILHIIEEKYDSTREMKDEGIDGFINIDNKSKTLTKKFFAIYGPRSQTQWNVKKQKIKDDLDSVIRYSIKNQIIIDRWYAVINFELSPTQYEEIMSLCKDKGVNFEWYYPTKLINKLDTVDKMLRASASMDSLIVPTTKFTDNHFHTFAKEALNKFNEYETATREEQSSILDKYLEGLLIYINLKTERFACNLFPVNEKGELVKPYMVYQLLTELTQISHNLSLVYEYNPEKRAFVTYSYEEDANILNLPSNPPNKLNFIWRKDNNCYYLHIDNLNTLHMIIKKLKLQNELEGNYSIEKMLHSLYTSIQC